MGEINFNTLDILIEKVECKFLKEDLYCEVDTLIKESKKMQKDIFDLELQVEFLLHEIYIERVKRE